MSPYVFVLESWVNLHRHVSRSPSTFRQMTSRCYEKLKSYLALSQVCLVMPHMQLKCLITPVHSTVSRVLCAASTFSSILIEQEFALPVVTWQFEISNFTNLLNHILYTAVYKLTGWMLSLAFQNCGVSQ
jgi:hypothetical protein